MKSTTHNGLGRLNGDETGSVGNASGRWGQIGIGRMFVTLSGDDTVTVIALYPETPETAEEGAAAEVAADAEAVDATDGDAAATVEAPESEDAAPGEEDSGD